ncbi:MAG: branched-chain-amino-acid transaminase [Rhodospirillales bacterium]|nr:branched-chain-amino-acid transaminase [Rhodospirillales bacterium]
MSRAKYLSLNGKIIPWNEGTVHVFSPVVKYGAGLFEGLRGYWNDDKKEMFLFRVKEHMDRLAFGQRVMRYERIVDGDTLAEQCIALIRANEFKEAIHLRVMVYVDGDGEMGAPGPVSVAITAVPRPLPKQVIDGTTAHISSWQRISDVSIPARVKSNANYQNSRLAVLQSKADGYGAPILLNSRGKVSEGPGMCFFMIRNGKPVTPSVSNDILESVTRATLMDLFHESLDLEVTERDVDRTELYDAEEAFFCGTGWEVTPITSIDKIAVGNGKPGALTQKLQKVYFDVVLGKTNVHSEWRTPVYAGAKSKAAE